MFVLCCLALIGAAFAAVTAVSPQFVAPGVSSIYVWADAAGTASVCKTPALCVSTVSVISGSVEVELTAALGLVAGDEVTVTGAAPDGGTFVVKVLAPPKYAEWKQNDGVRIFATDDSEMTQSLRASCNGQEITRAVGSAYACSLNSLTITVLGTELEIIAMQRTFTISPPLAWVNIKRNIGVTPVATDIKLDTDPAKETVYLVRGSQTPTQLTYNPSSGAWETGSDFTMTGSIDDVVKVRVVTHVGGVMNDVTKDFPTSMVLGPEPVGFKLYTQGYVNMIDSDEEAITVCYDRNVIRCVGAIFFCASGGTCGCMNATTMSIITTPPENLFINEVLTPITVITEYPWWWWFFGAWVVIAIVLIIVRVVYSCRRRNKDKGAKPAIEGDTMPLPAEVPSSSSSSSSSH